MKKTATDRRFWIYVLGPDTAAWGEVAHDLVLGWWMLGDLRGFADRAALARAAAVSSGDPGCASCAAAGRAAACWSFVHDMAVGDVVIAVKGVRLMGLGVVTGGYRYEVDRPATLGHRRRVEWIARGARSFGGQSPSASWGQSPSAVLAELAGDSPLVRRAFAAYGKTLADADPGPYVNRVWWLATNIAYWSLDNEVSEDETFFYYKYNERGHVRTSGRAFDEISAGDLVLGYVGGPVKDRGVHALLRCEKSLGCGTYEGAWRENVVVFRKVKQLAVPIPWEVFRDNPVLMSAHMVRVKNVGSLFAFTAAQRDEVLHILGRLGVL